MTAQQYDLVLSTLNARYIHSAFGLRYLQANLGQHQSDSIIKEFTIDMVTEWVVEEILAHLPKLVGFGVYIWNVEPTLKVVRQLRALQPDLVIVLGGPEVSHEAQSQAICDLADVVISGWGEVSFRKCVEQV